MKNRSRDISYLQSLSKDIVKRFYHLFSDITASVWRRPNACEFLFSTAVEFFFRHEFPQSKRSIFFKGKLSLAPVRLQDLSKNLSFKLCPARVLFMTINSPIEQIIVYYKYIIYDATHAIIFKILIHSLRQMHLEALPSP